MRSLRERTSLRVGTGIDFEAVDALIEEVIVDAHGDAEQIQAFQQVLADRLDLPTDAYVIGEPVLLLAIDFSLCSSQLR